MPQNQDELRRRVIRLAHERPDLRPHLLGALDPGHSRKAWWVSVPATPLRFGYEGDPAEAALRAKELGRIIDTGIESLREASRTLWKQVARELMANAEIDAQPDLSRTVAAMVFTDAYENLGEDAKAYFMKVPVPR